MPKLPWKINDIRQHVGAIDGRVAPTIILKNATYLHSVFKTWLVADIWILGDRIVYVGHEEPKNVEGTEIVDLAEKVVVPGYIEPHVHPFQLYNPVTFADYAAQRGTTTFISDNAEFIKMVEDKEAFQMLDELNKKPFSYYWWARFDSQSERENEREIFSNETVTDWLERPDVLLGGELTAWPRLVQGDDLMLSWIHHAKAHDKKVEGHLPGASDRTLARMRLFGIDGDHEAMTAAEVENRLYHGYGVTLRYSSIRPDLPQIAKDLVKLDHPVFDHLMMTTDGSTPSFYKDGVMDKCIQAVIDAGVKPIDAYLMASYNVARYYDMSHLHGMIATGRFASLNILENESTPNPISVLSKGVWLKRDGVRTHAIEGDHLSAFKPLTIDFDVLDDDFQFSSLIGIEMVNDVITKPYSISANRELKALPLGTDESFLVMIDRDGKWRINTVIKGFDTHISGFATSYTNTGDFILIGKNIEDMKFAFRQLKEQNGGIVLAENQEVVARIDLPIAGFTSNKSVEEIIEEELRLKEAARERGYRHSDLIYTLLFLQSTHLPYIRVTQVGLFDVMKNQVLLPSVMR